MQSSSKPPIAEKKPHDTTIHGDTLTDDYFWLREKTNPEVVKYLNAENTYTDEVTRDLNPFCENLYNEFLSHIKQTDLSVPYRLGRFYYYSRTEEGLQYPVYCRKTISPGSVEEVLLDLNELSNGRPYLAVSVYTVSEDGNLLAYSIDTTGFRQYELFIKDLKTGRLLADRIGTVTSAVWAADNRTLFYVKEDDAKRPYRLYRRRLGTRKDVLIYEDNDELYRVDVHKTRDRKFILLESASSETSEWRFLDSTDPEGTFRMISERQPGHEYYVDHRENLFYIRTNIDAINFRIMEAPDTDPEKSNWKELIAHRSDVKIEDVDLFKNHAVLAERYQGLVQLKILDFATGEVKSVAFPEPVYSVFPSKNPEFEVDAYRFNYQSFLTPGSIYEYDMRTGERNLLKETEVPGGYDRSLYESKRLWATADDGVKVPISVVMKKGIRLDGKNPLLLHGYGSYGYPSSVTFSPTRLSLLDRGVLFATAHIRGGGDMGEAWHNDGKMMKKRNTFTDFIACADYLVHERYTGHDCMAIQGGSAGGLLIAAVLNMRPDVCKVAHLAVPFVDVINTMLDESLPLTVGEFLEWGNPKKKEEYDYMKTYCPYTNLTKKNYPAILVTTSFNDSQVMYWEPAKYVAKLRSLKTDNNPLLFKIKMEAGHGGASGRYDYLKDQAFNYAFVLNQLGISE